MIWRAIAVAILGSTTLGAAPAMAKTDQSSIVEELESHGYLVTETRRTLLGRVKVIGISGRTRREIVLDPTTGEILRDYSDSYDRDQSSGKSESSSSAGGETGGETGGGSGGETGGGSGTETSGGSASGGETSGTKEGDRVRK